MGINIIFVIYEKFVMDFRLYYKHYFAILLAFLQPIIVLGYYGPIHSISMVWGSDLQPLFITCNAITSFLFFTRPKWLVPAVLLLLLTAFSVNLWPRFHTLLALAFFLSCFFPMLIINRLRYYAYVYLGCIVMGYYYGLFWLEFWAVYVMCFYHLHLLYHIEQLTKDNHD